MTTEMILLTTVGVFAALATLGRVRDAVSSQADELTSAIESTTARSRDRSPNVPEFSGTGCLVLEGANAEF